MLLEFWRSINMAFAKSSVKILCYATFARVSISAISLQEKGESNLLYAIVYIIL